MSVSDIPTRKLYDCDGVVQSYPIPYQYLAESDNTVKHIDSTGLIITTLVLDDAGANGFVITAGAVVTNTLYPDTDQIWLIRDTPRTQASVRKNNRRTAASVDDGSYDKLTMIVQEMEDVDERTLTMADTTPTDVSLEYPAPVARRVAIWDATGKFLEYTIYDPDTQQSGAAASAVAAADSETAAGLSEDAAAASEIAAAASAAAAGSTVSGRNVIVNGGCLVSQIKSAAITNVDFNGAVDMFITRTSAGQSAGSLVEQAATTLLGTSGFSLKIGNLTHIAASSTFINHRTEAANSKRFVNNPGVVSCKVYQDTGVAVDYTIQKLNASAENNFAAGTTSDSGAISVPSGVETIISWAIADCGACGNGIQFEIEIEHGLIAAKNFYLTELQFEAGATRTDFEPKTFEEEFPRCERYFEQSYEYGAYLGDVGATYGVIQELAARNIATGTPGPRWRTPKIKRPTVVVWSPVTGAANQADNGGSDTGATAYRASMTGCTQVTVAAASAAADIEYHYSADAWL